MADRPRYVATLGIFFMMIVAIVGVYGALALTFSMFSRDVVAGNKGNKVRTSLDRAT